MESLIPFLLSEVSFFWTIHCVCWTHQHLEADPMTRPQLLKQALNHLASAVNFNSESADAYYHLAVALLQAGSTRDLEGCIRAARHAVELESNGIRYWHLLGLALSADGQHTQAREVLEIGESLQTDEDDEIPNEEVVSKHGDAHLTVDKESALADFNAPTHT
jgi:tetratricopeptide (TPR) repeat protein